MYLGRKKRRRINVNKLIGVLFFSLLLVFAVCFFLQSDFFNLTEIIVENNKYLTNSQIEKLLGVNKNRNIFTYELGKIEDNVVKNTYVKSCEIKRKMPNKLVVNVTEKKIIGPIYNGENYCYIDDKGNYVDELENGKKYKFIIGVKYTVNKKKVKFENIKDKSILISLVKEMEDENILKQMKYIDLNEKSTINMKTKKGLKIEINKEENMQKEIAKLTEVLMDLQNRQEYSGNIDMTYKNYILYTP